MQTGHLSEFISWGDLIVKLFIKNIFKKTGDDYSLKTKKKYLQLCIGYELNTYILKKIQSARHVSCN